MDSAQINMISVWREEDFEDAYRVEQGLEEIITLSPRAEEVPPAHDSIMDRNAENEEDSERYTRWKIVLFFVGLVIAIIGIVLLAMAAMSYATKAPAKGAPPAAMDINEEVASEAPAL